VHASLLCIGDIHLGRRPSSLPDEWLDAGIPAEELTSAAAWLRAVAFAREQAVDAVLLAGDVVEDDNRFFEAFGPLERGVRELCGAGIQVLAVAGNHDVHVLPRLARAIDGFHLLGQGGRWERREIKKEGKVVAEIVGYSFASARVVTSPLESGWPEQELAERAQVPRLGLLHCDLDQNASPYAPVHSAELLGRGIDLWLLGHVHRPTLSLPQGYGYLGSLLGLDPSERGRHGPWLLSIDPSIQGGIALEHVPLAPLRWESVELAADGFDGVEELEPAILHALTALHGSLQKELEHARAVGCRVVLSGRARLHRELRAYLAQTDLGELRLRRDHVTYFVERIDERVQAPLDLEALARNDDPPGLLARKLQMLSDRESAARLLARAREALSAGARRPAFAALGSPDLSDPEVEDLLRRAAELALGELVATGPGGA
jgi:DNA repair exonuclease SbcCD nuclease subunit